MIERRPPRPTSSRKAAVLSLPPDTPDNLITSIGRRRRAINELHRIQKEYEANNPPPAQADAKLVGREQQHVTAPPPQDV
jgi:hypothetical protein